MLDSIETGHESRFDFPEIKDPQPRPYLLAGSPRSGSSWVAHLMWETGLLGAPLEYLNFEPSGPQGAAALSHDRQCACWDYALRYRTSPNGIFGLKAFPLQLEELGRFNPVLLTRIIRFLFPGEGRGKVVRLVRRDRVAHAISYARAMATGLWRQEQEAARKELPRPAFSRRAVDRAMRLIAMQEGAWDSMTRDLGIKPFIVEYEEVVDDPNRSIGLMASYLDVSLNPTMRISVPRIDRQSQSDAQTWRELYDRG